MLIQFTRNKYISWKSFSPINADVNDQTSIVINILTCSIGNASDRPWYLEAKAVYV